MTSDRAVADERTCVVVPEATVRALVSRRDVFGIVRAATLGSAVRHGPGVSAMLSGHDVGVKIGAVEGGAFGVKVRAGAEGNYLTVAWDGRRALAGLVESSYLTYCRTAAALLLPATELGSPVGEVLVMGGGRLGQACALLARDLHPDARIHLWSRTPGRLGGECGQAVDGWWTPDRGRSARFDLVVTCTRSPVPLPLETVESAFVSVGGAVAGRRRELPDNLLRGVGAIYADDPDQVRLRCGDLDALAHGPAVEPLGDLVHGTGPAAGRTLTFVCGSGGYDVLLAEHVLRLTACGSERSTSQEREEGP
jgi:ornithine cyclodeaminase/alanine dehydrogenase-like protein (mu-crystallin family)